MNKLEAKKQIDEIMADFAFDKVEKAMLAVDWKWHICMFHGVEHCITPTVPMLRAKAKELLEEASATGKGSGTGGFEVENDGEKLWLTFVLEESV